MPWNHTESTFVFNGTGKLRTPIETAGILGGIADRVVVQGDGRIIVGGRDTRAASIAVLRYLPNGFSDLSFNGTGMVLGANSAGVALDAGLQSDRKIVLAGRSTQAAGSDFAVWRFNSDGNGVQSFVEKE